ncbi:hypothetical protein [Parachlamydia sp. AcF125]|uniref:hypothetical protein n=1 Tax=Parachlamydia sp. AcF125 TaxID=2795736 RepID=UPI001BD86245|nr:hypothetical protein [Parachlamydia sp. AcF125]MBS4167623.1 hypothetical protein [Parachlamydia sp. AcF125]
MNILLFVTSLLMLMTLMTYARLESYRSFAIIQSQFEFYMKNLEREEYKKSAKKWYEEHVATTKEQTEENKQKKSRASSTLPIALFLNREEREKKQELHTQFALMAKNLLFALYGHTKFFKEALEEDRRFLDQLLKAISQSVEDLPSNQKIKNAGDLSTLPLKDPHLHDIFYLMLKGGTEIPAEEKGTVEVNVSYPPLAKYLTLSNKTQIRVFLASKPLLMAIFGEPTLVEEILRKRVELYKEVKAEDGMKVEEATQIFKDLFENRRLGEIISEVLDFTVSKKDPQPYE